MHTYAIKGSVNFNEAETNDGNITTDIDCVINADNLGAEAAKGQFFAENPQYDDFFGNAKTCDAATYGNQGASFIDYTDNERWLDVELIK